jgi:hypothetical protein
MAAKKKAAKKSKRGRSKADIALEAWLETQPPEVRESIPPSEYRPSGSDARARKELALWQARDGDVAKTARRLKIEADTERERERGRDRRGRERVAGMRRNDTGVLESTEATQPSLRDVWAGMTPKQRWVVWTADRKRFDKLKSDAEGHRLDADTKWMAVQLKALADRVLARPTPELKAKVRQAFDAVEERPLCHAWALEYAAALMAIKKHASPHSEVEKAAIGLPPHVLIESVFKTNVSSEMPPSLAVPMYISRPVRRWIYDHLTPANKAGGGKYPWPNMAKLLLRPMELANRVERDNKETARAIREYGVSSHPGVILTPS